jgi:hypothetical protein
MADIEKQEARYRPQEVEEYITEKGWVTRMKGDNYCIQTCPFCDNPKWNFEIHKDKGMISCWACGVKGGFLDLKKQMGDWDGKRGKARPKVASIEPPRKRPVEPPKGLTDSVLMLHQKLWTRPPVLTYLKARGFNEETLAHFKVGAQKQEDGYWVVLPHLVGGEAMNAKFRSAEPKGRWKQQKGGAKVLFNQDALEGNTEIIIAEGEMKAMALWQMGFKNVVALTSGVANFYPEWVDQLESKEKIYLCLDNDKDGQENAERLALRLGMNRCYNIVLPDAKDPDEYFFVGGHTREDFIYEMGRARLYDIKNLVNLDGALKRLRDNLLGKNIDNLGLMSPWPELNRLTKGFRDGELVVLSAPPKVGKTTLALNISDYLARENKVPILFYCMEMGPERLAQKETCLLLQLEDELLTAEDVSEARYLLKGVPLYLPERVRSAALEEVIETMRAAHKRYGIRMIVFDNLHFLVRSDERLREKLGVAVQQFKLLAEELRIPIILIVHPRKMRGDQVMTSHDMRDTAAIHADADMVIVMHRKRIATGDEEERDPLGGIDDGPEVEGIFEAETQIIVDAARYAPGGRTVLYYEGAQSRFRSMTEQERNHANQR